MHGGSDDGRPASLASRLQSPRDAAAVAEQGLLATGILASLQRLAWRRVDVSFRHASLPLLAHQHIQVQRSWVNSVGLPVAQHLARSLKAMEAARRRGSEWRRAEAGASAPAPRAAKHPEAGPEQAVPWGHGSVASALACDG